MKPITRLSRDRSLLIPSVPEAHIQEQVMPMFRQVAGTLHLEPLKLLVVAAVRMARLVQDMLNQEAPEEVVKEKL